MARPAGQDLTGRVEILLSSNPRFPRQTFRCAIGRGAYTDVYRGELQQQGAPVVLVAVKIFRATLNDDDQRVEAMNRRLIRETNVWLALHHDNIHPYLGYCEDLGYSVALISEFCGNGTIMEYTSRHPLADRWKFVRDVAKGLRYLHSENIIHADLQRNNVLIDDSGNARLCDFGRARIIGDVAYSTNLLAGCLPYMAPELLPEEEIDVDELFTLSSDVYAFGILAFEIFTGELHLGRNRRGVGSMACIMRRIREGRRPERSLDVGRRMSNAVWGTLEQCWVHEPTLRLSADEIIQGITM